MSVYNTCFRKITSRIFQSLAGKELKPNSSALPLFRSRAFDLNSLTSLRRQSRAPRFSLWGHYKGEFVHQYVISEGSDEE